MRTWSLVPVVAALSISGSRRRVKRSMRRGIEGERGGGNERSKKDEGGMNR
jgi:hypothetical protein